MNYNLTYHREGDYLIPDVVPPVSPKIGIWGERRRRYLMKHKKPIYTGMLLDGTLNAHLEEVDRSAYEMFDRLIAKKSEQDGVNEQLKATDQMAWVGAMNNIRNCAEEIVFNDLIYS